MNIVDILKLLLVVGAVGGGVLVYNNVKPSNPKIVSSGRTVLGVQQKLKDSLNSQEEEHSGSVVKFFKEQVVPAIVNSPILSPITKTTNQVNTAVESMKSLPKDQRNAVCRQICSE